MPIVEKAAPLVAALLKDSRISIVSGLLGLLVNCNPNDHEALTQKLKDDPDLYAKLKNLENTHADWLRNL
jgi:hypothetical protein